MLTVSQVARQLAVGTKVVYRLCASGELSHARIGNGRGIIRIDQAAVDAFIARSTAVACEVKRPEIRRRKVSLKHLKARK